MRSDLLNKIFQTIREYHMIEPGMRVIAGVSGGADSLCLLLALAAFREQTPFGLAVVHVEHGLRGQESLEDAEFVERLCRKKGIYCRVTHADVQKYANENGLSCEEAARICRYRIFEELRQEWKADRVAVAHHEEDQAETILWNLFRGSGLRGLCGIRPVRGALIRPLLFTTRTEIEEFLTAGGQSWRTDCTNLDQNFTRNRLRLSILPKLEQTMNSQAVRHIAQAGGRLRQAEEYIEKMTQTAAERCLCMRNGEVCLLLEPYEKEEPLIRQELLKLALLWCTQGRKEIMAEERPSPLAQAGRSDKSSLPDCVRKEAGLPDSNDSEYGMKDVGAVHIAMLGRLAGLDCGKSCDLPGRIRAVREEGLLRFRRRQQENNRQSLCGPDEFTGAKEKSRPEEENSIGRPDTAVMDIGGTNSLPVCRIARGCPYGWAEEQKNKSVPRVCAVRITAELFRNSKELQNQISEGKKYTKWLSCDIIKKGLQIRTRQTGDYLTVNSLGGRKKLKDYMIDCKIPRDKRDQVWLLTDGPHVLWVIGWRISEAAKVLPDTRDVVRVCIENV